MAWTYSGDPSTSSRDEVRLLVGDTTYSSILSLQDAEVDWAIAHASETPPNLYHVASDVAEMMANRALAQVTNSRKIDDLEVAEDYKSTAQALHELSKRLMKGRTRFSPGLPIFQDTNNNAFSLGMHDDLTGFGSGSDLKTGF